MTDVPGTAVPVAPVTEEPPSLSVLVMARVAWAPRLSVSVAETDGGVGGRGRGRVRRRWDRWPPAGPCPTASG